MVAAPAGVQRVEDPAQGGLPEPAHGLRGELQLAALPPEVPLLLQLALDLLERLQVVDGRPAQGTADRGLVDVVEPGSGVVLAERLLQPAEVGELLQGADGVAHAEGLVAVHRLRGVPREVGAAGVQGLAEAGHLLAQAGLSQRLVDQPLQLLALLRGHGREHPLGRGGPAGQDVDQLFEIAGILRKEFPMLLHELVEIILGVLAAGVSVQHVVQIRHHLPDPFHRLWIGIGQGFPHAAEPAVEDLPAQQVAQLLERLAGRRRAPLVRAQLLHRARGVARHRVELRLAQPRVVGGVGEQLGPFLADGLVQKGPGAF